jgi:glycosyltransferase involved in cell wall biosynthesis
MRVLKVIHGYPPLYQAGSEVYSQSLCNELASQGVEVTVFSREENPYRPDYDFRFTQTSEGLPHYLVNLPREKDGFSHPEMDRKFSELLQHLRPDLVHFGHLNHLSVGLVQEAKKAGLPVVFTLHDFWLLCPRGQFLQTNFGEVQFHQLCDKQDNNKCARVCYNAYASHPNDEVDLASWENWVKKRMEATDKVLQLTDLFLAPSQYLRSRFLAERPDLATKITILRYGFPTHYLKQTIVPPERSNYVFGYIGTHITSKGVNLLISAFKQLKGDAQLLIWGRDNGQSTGALREMAKGANIEFRGEYINKDIADEVFANIDCLVTPSIWTENAPLVIQEAQQARVPIITADTGGMAELVQHNVNGLLFIHRDVESLREKMQEAINYPEELRMLGKKGFLYSENGDVIPIQQHVLQIIKIYKQLINY